MASNSQYSAPKSPHISTLDSGEVTPSYPMTLSTLEHNMNFNGAKPEEEKATSLYTTSHSVLEQARTSNNANGSEAKSKPQPASSPTTEEYQLSHSEKRGGVYIGNIKTLYDEIDEMYEQVEIYGWAFNRTLPLALRVNYSCWLSDEEFERMDRWSWSRASSKKGGSRNSSVSPRGSLKSYD